MTPERLAEIRRRDKEDWTAQYGWQQEARLDRRELLAEIDRLNAVFVMAGDEQTDLAAEVIRLSRILVNVDDLASHLDEVIDVPSYVGLWIRRTLAGPFADRRPRTDELLGVAEDWLGGQSVDDYIDEIRGDE